MSDPRDAIRQYLATGGTFAKGGIIRADDHNRNPVTSARLAETQRELAAAQAAFAASQADLTAMERERDEARALNRQLADHLASAHTGWGKVLAERDEARAELDQVTTTLRIFRNSQSADVIALRTARDKARAEVKQLRAQLAPVHAWAVADGDLAWRCGACGQPIRRGEAFQPTGLGRHDHIYCPTPTQET